MRTIAGMARYEFLLHWRGRALRVLAITMVLVTAAGVLIYRATPETLLAPQAGGQPTLAIDTVITFLTFPALVVLIAFVLPVAASETIPVDKHYKVNELMNSVPITTAQYLSGKVLGYWLASLSALGVTLAVNLAIWLSVVRDFNIVAYLELWVIAAIILVINSGIAILISATQPNRIRAAALVIFVLILSTLLLENTSDTQSLAASINLSRAEIIGYSIDQAGSEGLRLAAPQVYVSMIAGVIELGAAFALMWAWRRRGE